jgi:hypothetical protein
MQKDNGLVLFYEFNKIIFVLKNWKIINRKIKDLIVKE